MNPMVVQCASCHTEFQLDPLKVPAEGVRARCTVCSAVIVVPPPSRDEHEEEGRPSASAEAWSRTEAYQDRSAAAPQPLTSAEGPAAPAGGERLDAPAVADHTAVQKRPINPFLTRDPGLRAKRLARALVSDIVAYHPAKHAEGLRDGTLKTLFRDEIKKSYDEYVDQVGRDVAESTTYFQDALNEVLAAGKRLF